MKRSSAKKTIALVLCLLLAFSLAGCKSSAVKETEKLIAAIGQVTVDSRAAVEAAETAYAALSDSDKAQVENAAALTEARAALDAALEEAKRRAVIGKWTMEADAAAEIAEQMAGELGMDAQQLRDQIGKFPFKAVLELKEDGIYTMEVDRESFKESFSGLMQNMKPFLKELLVKSIAREFLGRDDASAEEMEEALGSTLDEFISVYTGMTLDDLIDLTLAELDPDEAVGSLEDVDQEGRYTLDLKNDVICFSDGLEKEPDAANGEKFVLKDGVMEITDHSGKGFFAQMYPVTLTKVG